MNVDIGVEKDSGEVAELLGVLGRQVGDFACFATPGFNLGMAVEVVGERGGNDVSLGQNPCAAVDGFLDEREQERVVGTPEDDGVDRGVVVEESVDIFVDKEAGAVAVGFGVLDQRHPKGAGARRCLI